MKLTVTKYLNVRVGKPSLNAPCYQYLAPGSELEVDGQLYKGDLYDGVDTWFKDAAGNYYWSNGVEHEVSADISNMDFWFEQFDMAGIQKTENGDNANVLILDSGINNFLPAFAGAVIAPVKNFVVNSTTTNSIDTDMHGSHCAGLIAGRVTQYKIGASLKSKLYVAKITENGELDDAATLKTALTEFLKNVYDFDVISISQTIINDDPELQNIMQQHINKNRIIIAAIGNDSQLNNSNKKRYPGFYNNCISVGACENDNTLAKYTCYPSKADIFCYGTNVKSVRGKSYPEPLTGTSQSTAIVAGICVLIISFLKKNNIDYDQDAIRNLLKKYSLKVTGFPNYSIINPPLIFNKLLKAKQNESKSLQDFINSDPAANQ